MNNNPEINRFAEILEVKLKQGRADLTVKLKGEAESVNLSLNYVLEENALCITNVKTSKEWLNALAEIFKEKYSRINLSSLGIEKNGIKANLVKLLL
jgi:molybdate-binding protein